MSRDHPTDHRIIDELTAACTGAGAGDAEALRTRLAIDAEHEGLLDLAYRTLDSPIGPLLVALSPHGLVRVAFGSEGHDAVLAQLAAAISPRILGSSRRTDDVARQLDEYFTGRRRHFDVPVDLQLARGFRRAVLSHLLEIDYGATQSYATVARAAGNRNAVRAVGSACSHNPVPVVVPCHRVVRSDGTMGGYLGGIEAKQVLLALEASA
ncbi:MAG: methylated-DNA--[protein]-cysteine S-methyltransferase [Actinomycetota bacterium]|nr:methylated-DNA--[protein]-cysteine S-methyltransferase [Actinomycetota bacterium]